MKIKGIRRQWLYMMSKCNVLTAHRERGAIIIMYLSRSSGASEVEKTRCFNFGWRGAGFVSSFLFGTKQRPQTCNDVHTTFTTDPKTPDVLRWILYSPHGIRTSNVLPTRANSLYCPCTSHLCSLNLTQMHLYPGSPSPLTMAHRRRSIWV